MKTAVAFVMLFIVSIVVAATGTPMPKVGPLGDVNLIGCPPNVLLELRAYNFEPPSERFWMAHGLGLRGEPNFVVALWMPEGLVEGEEPDPAQALFYIDANRDGQAEEVIPWLTAIERYEQNWCVVYGKIRANQP